MSPPGTLLVREILPFVLLTAACGAAVSQPAAPSPTPSTTAPSASPPAPSGEPKDAFDDLAARGPALAPGMREVARRAGDGHPVELVRALAADACVRVAFASTTPVAASLVDQRGEVLAATTGLASEGALGDHGPVCVRRGDVVSATAEGATGRVRWIAWQAP